MALSPLWDRMSFWGAGPDRHEVVEMDVEEN